MDTYKYYECINNSNLLKIDDGIEGVFLQISTGGIGIMVDTGNYDNIPFRSITKDEFHKIIKHNDIPQLLAYLA